MEKRRRARINNCLNELKTLILDAMKKDVSTDIFRLGETTMKATTIKGTHLQKQ